MSLKELAKQYSLSDNTRWGKLGEAIDATIEIPGEIWECGCWKGGTALWMKGHLGNRNKILRLFDTFNGMPFFSKEDYHKIGDLSASYAQIQELFNGMDNVFIHKGIIPESFNGLEKTLISVAHIDLDQYESVKLCLEWIYPRVASGGWIIFDDYNCSSCLGAKKAVDEFFGDAKDQLTHSSIAYNPQSYIIKK